jgi:hypothetical protein
MLFHVFISNYCARHILIFGVNVYSNASPTTGVTFFKNIVVGETKAIREL